MDSQFFDTQEDDEFFLKNLPNSDMMIDKLFLNKNILYFPITTNTHTLIKPFDFATPKNANEDEDFVSIDNKPASTTPSKPKGKQVKKSSQFSQKNKPQQQSKIAPQVQTQLPKFKITQTIEVAPNWKIIHDFNKYILEKLSIDPETSIDVETVKVCGKIFPFREDIQETVSPFNPEKLKSFDYKFYGSACTRDDPILMDENQEEANIFITDRIMSVIMTSVYFSHPWHIKISKVGDKIFFDKDDKSFIDYVSVNESDNVPAQDEDDKSINSYKNLCIEATYINEYIKEQLIYTKDNIKENEKNEEAENEEEEGEEDEEKEKEKEDYDPNPFVEEGVDENQVENVIYRYRQFTVGDMVVLVRCQVHSYEINGAGKKEYVNIYALNEYDKSTYLTKDSNLFSTLIRKEVQTNHLKIAKWGVCSYLGDVEKLKIAFVSRKDVKDNKEHLISGIYEIPTEQILRVTNFNKEIAWGIFKEIIDLVQRQKEDGDYILMKTTGLTGYKFMLKLYRVPKEEEK
ncbi:MAG: eukaryotic translation initiation factor 3 subunit D [archaeon]|nr:eukaryotic translation initiation factor 3 subunit D [archaeon]